MIIYYHCTRDSALLLDIIFTNLSSLHPLFMKYNIILVVISVVFPPLTVPPLEAPMNVMAVNVGTTSVLVSWDVVNDADRYTVTFTRAMGGEQQGACTGSIHTASVTVDAPSTTASIDIGQDVEESVTNMLRAYSTYFITVVASNDGGNSDNSDQISILTSQIGMRLM